MKKKFLTIIAVIFMTASVFGLGMSNLPSEGKEIILYKGNVVIWHAINWTLEIDTKKYTKLLGSGGDDYFKVYTFTGTPVGPESDHTGSLSSWKSFSIINCEDLTWSWKL